MIKNTIIVCSIISFFCGIIKHIISAAGGEKITKVINCIAGIILLITIFQVLNNDYQIDFSLAAPNSHDYEEISQNVLDTAIQKAEEDFSKIICNDLYAEFNISPIECTIKLDREELSVETVKIYYSKDNYLLSAYEIKNYLNIKYSIDAEVIFI